MACCVPVCVLGSRHCNVDVSATTPPVHSSIDVPFEGTYTYLHGTLKHGHPVYWSTATHLYLFYVISQFQVSGWVLHDDLQSQLYPYAFGYLYPSNLILSGELLSGGWVFRLIPMLQRK
eukprot:TRINITY_DN711_c0_g1_i1.p1 TRINITY_DN711_c0_g1~~TRINITY_DN711_c0_g1_i1.p1  ORF type:complete len:119 (-),score=3.71 TRINITY_DN711_c0_g1_i1:188-544(-)